MRLIRQLFCFGVVGVAATLTHYLLALGAHEGLRLSVYLAHLVGYLAAMAVSYFGHGLFTFRVRLTRQTLHRFAMASVSIFMLSEGLLWALENGTAWSHRMTLIAVVLFVPMVSFLLNKLWVYRLTDHTVSNSL